MSELPSFWGLNNIPSCYNVTFIHGWTQVASTSGLLWIMVLCTWVYKYLFESLLSVPLGVSPEVGFGGHMVIVCLIFLGIIILFEDIELYIDKKKKSNHCIVLIFFISLWIFHHRLAFVYRSMPRMTAPTHTNKYKKPENLDSLYFVWQANSFKS